MIIYLAGNLEPARSEMFMNMIKKRLYSYHYHSEDGGYFPDLQKRIKHNANISGRHNSKRTS